MSSKTGKRPLRTLSAHEKLEAIRRVHDGESKASVARDIGVPESTLRGWCKNEDKISYLSRQSSPETDESLDQPGTSKRIKVEEASSTQPFNLSLKSSGGSIIESPQDLSRNGAEHKITVKDTSKSNNNLMSVSERNRAELTRLRVELGLNRPEIFMPSVNGNSFTQDLTNLSFINQWNTFLLQQQRSLQSSKKITSSTDINNMRLSPVSNNLLTTVDKDKSKHLPKEKLSTHESVTGWLQSQEPLLGLPQHHVPTCIAATPATTCTSYTSTATPTTSSSTNLPSSFPAALNGMSLEAWFCGWSREVQNKKILAAYQASLQEPQPILYQQLTREVAQRTSTTVSPRISPCMTPSPPMQTSPDQQNAENLSLKDQRQKIYAEKATSRARAVLDNILFNNNNNETHKDDSEEDGGKLSQSEAVEHGEMFLKWLESCSDPTVTAMQIMQFRTLLNNVKSAADRKNGELQNKTKVKRKQSNILCRQVVRYKKPPSLIFEKPAPFQRPQQIFH